MIRRFVFAVVVAVGLAAVFVCAPFLAAAGWAAASGATFSEVRSGSMAPAIPVGAIVVVRPVDVSRIAPGSIIVFEHPDRPGLLVTHRVIHVLDRPEGRFFQTRGDANPTDDPFIVPARAVRGRLAWQLRGVGGFPSLLASTTTRVLVVGVTLVLLALGEFAERSARLRQVRRRSRCRRPVPAP